MASMFTPIRIKRSFISRAASPELPRPYTFAGGEDFTQPVQLIFVHQRVTFVQKLLVGVQNLSGSAVCDGFLIQFIEPFFVVEEKFPISFVAAFLCEPGQDGSDT